MLEGHVPQGLEVQILSSPLIFTGVREDLKRSRDSVLYKEGPTDRRTRFPWERRVAEPERP